ncbi:MAG: vWA domain-containing protein [Candidatus Altiarchaeota archaeon]
MNKQEKVLYILLISLLTSIGNLANVSADEPPKIVSFTAQPNPAFVNSEVIFLIEATDDIGLEKISLEDNSGNIEECSCYSSRTCTSLTCCKEPPCFIKKFSSAGEYTFCAFATDTSGKNSEKVCINLTIRTVSECEEIKLYDSSQDVVIATKIKTKKLHKEVDGFDGYPLECCPYCKDIEINLSNCEKIKGSFSGYRVVTYPHSSAEIYSKLNFPENIFQGIEKPFVLCYAKKSETESIFGVVDAQLYNPIDFIYNDKILWYWLIEKVDNNKKDMYFLAEEDISFEKEKKEYVIVDARAYSDAVNKLLFDECYHKQPESLECTFDCVSSGLCPCNVFPWGCCPSCEQVYDYTECIYEKYLNLWGRPYSDYLFCYRTPLKDTAWCKQRTSLPSSVVNYPWYSFGVKDKEEKTSRNFETADDEYLEKQHEWNEMQEVQEMPDRSTIKSVLKVPEAYCTHNFDSKLFREVWVKIFTNTPYLNDERNNMQWGRTGKNVLYAGGGFRREPACWWECDRMCAPFCNCYCSQCPYFPCRLSAYFNSGVTNVIKIIIPDIEIRTSGVRITQNSPTKVTVSNGALTVISTGNIPFRITTAIFTKDPASGVYTLTQVYYPSSNRAQFVIAQDITFKYDLKESADDLPISIKEHFETSLIDHTWACDPTCPGCCCGCCYAGPIVIKTEEYVNDAIGTAIDLDKRKIDALKEATKGFVDKVVPDVPVGLVSFSTSVISSLPLTTDKEQLYNEINSYRPMAATCIACGIQKGTELLSGAEGKKHIILFSDGVPNIPTPSTAQEAAREAVRAAASEGITVHTVAIGDDAVLSFMEELANLGNGKFYAVSCDCPWECIYNELASIVKSELPAAVVLVNDISGSMAWRSSLNCVGKGPPVIHKNILRDINISVTGSVDSYGDEKFITHKGTLRIDVSPDIISKFILNVKNSKLEYSSLAYPIKHELYRKDIHHGIYMPALPYTPINPDPAYGNLPAHLTYKMEDAYGYESQIPTAVGFEFPYLAQGKEICPPNCFCPSYDLTDVTCVDYSEKPPVYYKRKDCICKETDQSYLRPLYSLRTYHDEEFYYYDFVDLYTKERSDLKIIDQRYPPEKTISQTGGSLAGEVEHIITKINVTKPKTCNEIKPENWQISSNDVIIPTDPADANACDKQSEPLKVHGLVWALSKCSQEPSSCNINTKFKVGRVIGPIEFLGVKYNAGPYVVVSSAGNAKEIVEKVIAKNEDFKNVDYYTAGSSGSALVRLILPLKICIQDGSYDQPSHIFNEMKIPFKQWSKECLTDADVIIFGCPSGPKGASAEEVRKFVENCGTYIGTDWNYDHLQGIFPGYFTGSKSGSGTAEIWEGSVRGTYDLSQDLREFFQTPYESISGWELLQGTVVIDSINNPETKVLARGSYSSGQYDKPMAVTFKYGNGRVFYYTIHIEGAASEAQKVFMSSFYSSAGMSTLPGTEEAGSTGIYILNFTTIQFPEFISNEDFKEASLTIFIHFRNDTLTQTYKLFPPRKEVTPPENKEFSINITLREPSKIIVESVGPSRYNLNPGTDAKINIRLINPLTNSGIPNRKITVKVEGYGISQDIRTDGEGRATFLFKLGEESTKVKFIFLGDEKFTETETSDYLDVISFKRIWWFLSPEFLLLLIVLIAMALFYRWFKGGRLKFEEIKKEVETKENE